MFDDIVDPQDQGKGNRRYRLRHRVGASARVVGKRGVSLECRIEDICRSGMFLTFNVLLPDGGPEPLEVGTEVQVSFAAPFGDEQRPVSLPVRVMRRLPHGVGVQILDLRDDGLKALRALALKAVRARVAAEERRTAGGAIWRKGRDNTRIMKSCRKVIERNLPKIISALLSELRRRLTAAGGNAESEVVASKAMAIGRTIERQVLMSFASLCDLDSTQELLLAPVAAARPAESGIGAAASDDELSVVEGAVVDEGVAITMVAERLHKKLRAKSFELDVRLAQLLQRRMDTDDNPLEPAVFGRTLWRSVADHARTPHLASCLGEAIAVGVVDRLGDLYDDLGATLDEYGAARAFDNEIPAAAHSAHG